MLVTYEVFKKTPQATRKSRKSLKTLQHTASVTEILVGRSTKSLKHEEPPINVEIRMKNLSTKETQVNLENKIRAEDLTNLGASGKHWQKLTDKMQLALREALEDAEKLQKMIKDLTEKNVLNKQMLEEANNLVKVIKELLAKIIIYDDDDDTGIDVNDLSTEDEAHEEETDVSDSD